MKHSKTKHSKARYACQWNLKERTPFALYLSLSWIVSGIVLACIKNLFLLFLNSILFYECTTICLSTCRLMCI